MGHKSSYAHYDPTTGWLVAVGLLQVLASVGAFWVARRAAIAAKKSADSLIAIERAWLVPLQFNPGRIIPDIKTDLRVWFSNKGKTPGWIIEQAYQVIRSPTAEIELLDDRSYGTASSFSYGIAIIPGEELPWEVQAEQKNRLIFSRGENGRIVSDRLFLFVCGFVRYKDVSETKRETYFCFRYWPDREDNEMWSAQGCPPEANRHT